MNAEQAIIIEKVRGEIRHIRQMLNEVAYRVEWMDKLTEKERSRIMDAYELIAKASYKL